MRRVLAFRHGKAAEREGYPSDHERPLAERGRRDSREVGRLLAERSVLPGLILSSSALRALETTREAAAAMGYDGPIREVGELYRATSAEDYLQVLRDHASGAECVMIVGHNPVMEELVSRLGGRSIGMKTAQLACLESGPNGTAWPTTVEEAEWSLAWVLGPEGIIT